MRIGTKKSVQTLYRGHSTLQSCTRDGVVRVQPAAGRASPAAGGLRPESSLVAGRPGDGLGGEGLSDD